MRLSSKFVWVSIGILIAGAMLCAILLMNVVRQQAEKDVASRATLMMEMANSVRQYTSEHVKPELLDEIYKPNTEFIQETVPAFAARQVFENLREQDVASEPFQYKEAVLNPTNPVDLANEFEAEIIRVMQTDPTEVSGFSGSQFYVARPIEVNNESCLACHSTPVVAPSALVETYGRTGGFGWKMGDIVGAQIVYVPNSALLKEAMSQFVLPALVFLVSIGTLAFALIYLLQRFVVEPIRVLEGFTNQLKEHEFELTKVNVNPISQVCEGQNEMGRLSHALLDMAYEVDAKTKKIEKANAQLRESEAGKRKIIENFPDQVMLFNREGVFLMFQESKDSRLPIKAKHVVGKRIQDAIPILADHQIQLTKALDSQEEVGFEYSFEFRDEVYECESRIIPLSNDEALTFVRDISQLKRRENDEIQAQKLESIGLLAGGIAHDFNNLLTGVLGQMSLAQRKLSSDAPARENIEKGIGSAERAATLTRQLLAYAGKGTHKIERFEITKFIEEGTSLLQSSVRKGDVHFTSTCQCPLNIEADQGHIQQILMNLVINASESYGEIGGIVDVTIGKHTIDDTFDTTCLITAVPKHGEYALLTVSDQGGGIPTDIKTQIFDPYFSTKGMGRGLGLAAVIGIIKRYDGGMCVISAEGDGTQMHVLLPLSEVYETTEDTQPTMTTEPFTNQQTILVVDDEDSVRQALQDILEMEGYQVITATNGIDAIAQYTQHQDAVDLTILDVEMPQMDGRKALHQLKTINQDAHVIMSSGYTRHAFDEELDITAFLQKPYQIEQLLKTVSIALPIPN